MHYEKFHDGTVKCVENEIPFEVPEGWEWERLGNVANIARGGSPRPIDAFITDDENGVNWIKIGDTEKDGKYISSTKEKIIPEGVSKSRYVHSGDFLLTNSMSFGRPYILRTNGCIHDGWLVIGDIEHVFDQDYLYYALSSSFMFQSLSLKAVGSTVKNLKSDSVKMILFPIPPFNEQKRIADYSEKLVENIDKISDSKDDLLLTADATKAKILDLAIRGKLVPQDENDEPASMLLEKIRSEKAELIKQGKLKRDKKESIIYKGDDNSYYMTGKKEPLELPFNLPNGWTWACLPEIVFFQEGPGIMKADFCKEGIPLIRISGLQTDRVTLEGCNYLSPQKVEEKWAHFKLEKGDIVICTSASIGKVSIVDEEAVGAIPYTGQIRFQMTPAITKDYFLFFAMSNIYLDQVNMLKTGNCIQHYGPTHLKQVIVPLPPINEQIRISKTISKYLDQIDMISEQLL